MSKLSGEKIYRALDRFQQTIEANAQASQQDSELTYYLWLSLKAFATNNMGELEEESAAVFYKLVKGLPEANQDLLRRLLLSEERAELTERPIFKHQSKRNVERDSSAPLWFDFTSGVISKDRTRLYQITDLRKKLLLSVLTASISDQFTSIAAFVAYYENVDFDEYHPRSEDYQYAHQLERAAKDLVQELKQYVPDLRVPERFFGMQKNDIHKKANINLKIPITYSVPEKNIRVINDVSIDTLSANSASLFEYLLVSGRVWSRADQVAQGMARLGNAQRGINTAIGLAFNSINVNKHTGDFFPLFPLIERKIDVGGVFWYRLNSENYELHAIE
jgi:hypothetical protein